MKLNLKMSGKEFNTSGKTIFEALQALPLSWEQIKAKGIITVKDGKKSYEHLLYLKPLRRVFANKTAMLIMAKRLELLLSTK